MSHTPGQILEEEILPRVERPSRYVGGEVNCCVRDPAAVELHLALVFPDLIDLGLGNLGIQILQAILNRLPWCYAETAWAPAPDMERELRRRALPWMTHQTRTPLGELDGIGFTLQSELTFTNILNILDLGGIPLRTADRREGDPLTFAGGPAVFNPEPLAPFMDFFVIGDGEEVIVEIAEVLRRHRRAPRRERLEALAGIEGVYVPALHPVEVTDDGRVLPAADEGHRVVKRLVSRLDGADYPVEMLVPWVEQVHDRASLEVLRGCTQGCRFCQAGMTTRPVRERTIDDIETLLERTLDATGYEEVSLVSLSTCDHSRVREMVDRVVARAAPRHVGVSLPSLRLDSFSVDLADRVADVRRTGLTFAPEAASPRLRALINKWIPDEELLGMADQAFARGWRHVKLYFMIGLPTERDDDIHAIADLTLRTLEVGRRHRRDARVHTGVSTFVPKPFTPFQWAEQITPEETARRQAILEDRFRGHRGVRFGRHDPRETFIEGLLSRADRRAADLIESAWRHGARLDAWHEHLDFEAWLQAIADTGTDVADALRAREVDERLPWDHLDILVDREWLAADWARALELRHAPDCRHRRCHRCGVIDRARPLCAHMLRNAVEGRKREREWRPPPRPAPQVPDPVQRVRLRIGRTGPLRHLSHHETVNAWIRALRRARAPLAWSQGFHPHPRVTFSCAFPVGEASRGDWMDVVLVERVDPSAFLARLQEVLPAHLHAWTAHEVPLGAPSLMQDVRAIRYRIEAPGLAADALAQRARELVAAEVLPVRRRRKVRGRRVEVEVDVRPSIVGLEARGGVLHLEVRTDAGTTARPRDLLPLLGLDPAACLVERSATVIGDAEAGEAPLLSSGLPEREASVSA